MGSYTFNKNILESNGQRFIKLLGTGSNNGFSFIPDFSNYVMISSWKNDQFREKFIQKNKLMKSILKRCHERIELKIDPYDYKGSWNNINPFENQSNYRKGKILIITRARVKLKKILEFLFSTFKASNSIKDSNAIYYKGVGELPIIEQSTISIWEDEETMKTFAYRNSEHLKIISKAKKKKWYSEELFVRSNIIHIKKIND